jgi:rubredoxin
MRCCPMCGNPVCGKCYQVVQGHQMCSKCAEKLFARLRDD